MANPPRPPPPPMPSTPPRSRSMNYHDRSSELALERIVREGSYGRIHRAKFKLTGAIVAVKVASESDAIRNEIRWLSKLSCPFVVGYFGSFRRGSDLWVVTDYCGGGYVNDLVRRRRELVPNDPRVAFPEPCVKAVCAGVVLGLEYLRASNVCHGDIRCQNLLLTNSGCVKISGLGKCKEVGGGSPRPSNGNRSNGASPRATDGGVDAWGLGVCTIEMAEGEEAPGAAQHAPLGGPAPSLAEPEKWSSQMSDFVDACFRTMDPDSQQMGRGGDARSRAVSHPPLASASRGREDPDARSYSSSLTTHPFVKDEIVRGRFGAPLFPWHLIPQR